MGKLTKKFKSIELNINNIGENSFNNVIEFLRNNSSKKFDESIELSINLGVDPRHADQMVKSVCYLPHGLGKNIRIAVFAKGDLAEEAKNAGADIVGDQDLFEQVSNGNINFDRCLATPDMMPLVGRLGKILGPRGLMPNPKVGTVTKDIAKAVADVKSGAIEFKTEKSGIIHSSVGKISFDNLKAFENVKSFINAVVKAKPQGAKGEYIKKIHISTTQGTSFKIDVKDFFNRL
jgi:large subunit ribosomal protein L1